MYNEFTLSASLMENLLLELNLHVAHCLYLSSKQQHHQQFYRGLNSNSPFEHHNFRNICSLTAYL